MKKNAYADTTIKATRKRLKHLKRNCDLNNPEQIKDFIANKQCSNAYKEVPPSAPPTQSNNELATRMNETPKTTKRSGGAIAPLKQSERLLKSIEP
jgi:hypothetical protein